MNKNQCIQTVSKQEPTMSNAKEKFDSSIQRCKHLVSGAQTANDVAEELLRFSVVLGVASFDAYVADLFSERFIPYLRENANKDSTAKFFDRIAFGTKEMLSLICERKDRPLRPIHTAVDRHLEKRSFQSEKAVDDLFSLYGLPNLFADAVKKTRTERTGKRVRAMVQRRHEIVHACDCKANGGISKIDAKTCEMWINALIRLTNAMDEIVSMKFRLKKSPKKC